MEFTLANINNEAISIIKENEEVFVPIRPICQALGISSSKQIEKIKNHPILSSTDTLRVSVGKDNRTREMVVLPYKYIFGWLFTISPNNVNEDAREALIKYQNECYNVLYDHFQDKAQFLEEKQQLITERKEYEKMLSEKLKEAKKLTQKAIQLEFDIWREDKRQLEIQHQE